MRVIDFNQGISVAWIFNFIRPDNKIISSRNLLKSCLNHLNNSIDVCKPGYYPCPIMITHLISLNTSSKLYASHVLLPKGEYKLTKYGKPISSNPDDRSPAAFEAKMGEHISFVVRPNRTEFSISVGDSVFKGRTSSPIPWGPHGEGPESWLEDLPLPIHWFVYSLRSIVNYYEYTNKETGQYIKGGSKLGNPAIAHMEKNWGGAFPKAWIWTEGVNPKNNVTFACTSGILHEFIDIKAELSGYKNPSKNIDCKFHPLNSVHVLNADGCSGHARLRAESLDCLVIFDVSTDPNFLSSCLITPQVTGFKLGCVESFNAVANITVFQRHGLSMIHTDSQIIEMAALEFGGEFMCNGKCPS